MGKSYYKYLGVNKAGGGVGKRPAGAGGKGKGTAGIPLTGKAKSLGGANKAATAGGGNGKRLVAGPRGAKGAGGRGSGGASTLSHADHHSTAVKVMNEYYHEEENRCSYEDERTTFSSTRRTTVKTSVKVTNEYYHEEETFRVSEEDIHDATELLADGGGGGGYGDYYKDAGVGHDDAGFEAVDGFLNGDAYYDDVAAAGFDYLYDDDGVDGPHDWW